MEAEDYPSLYQSANNASVSTQKLYTTAIRFYLILLILGAVFSKYAPKDVFWSIVSAIVLITTLALSIYQAFKRYDKIWYNGRAVAESVKTRTWRFIMRAEPYENADTIDIVKKRFISDTNEILKENKELGSYLDDECSSNCITEKMFKIRAMDLVDRIDYYRTKRIDNQRLWYATKAKWNKRQSLILFCVMVGANFLAIIFVILQVASPKNNYFPVEPLIVVAGSALTWMQVKRFQDLSTSYNLTAHEITIIRQNSDFVKDELSLSDFVKDSENAFSREHTQWVARKDK